MADVITLYDLTAANDRRFSPFCWRIRMALAHKGLDVALKPLRFTEIPAAGGDSWSTVPTIDDGGKIVTDSWRIARYLDETYPGPVPLIGESAGAISFVNHWTNTVLHPGVITLILSDIFEKLDPVDHAYFRESREKRFGNRLEEVQFGREERLEGFRRSLQPLRSIVSEQPFVGGEHADFADYLPFGGLMWPRVMSDFRLIEPDDPVEAWFLRVAALYPGVADGVPRFY